MKIGFIGLGIMGKPMAKNLLKEGYELVVLDRNKSVTDELVRLGAEIETSPKAVAAKTNIIITMLPNSPQVKEVALMENGIIEGAKPGTIFIDMSSISPVASKEVAKKLAEKGIEMLDAPVSGGEPKAIDGTLSIMVGGKEKIFNDVKDLLLKMGSNAVLCGEVGAGNVTKLANQVIVALNIAAMSEAFVLGTKAGVSPELIYNAIRGGLAGSTVLDAKAPMVMDRNFKPGFKIDLHIKDLTNVVEAGAAVGAPMLLTNQVLEMMRNLHENGEGQNDHSALVKFYEKLANVEVTK
ncbi:2-hydroxy-3-oxopropionate reductase [Clostridium arbusti]|uniref:2-hydroxy-3-oxopropionate reductase n=1 Tax=Clostridium arbusti TaxID=1137848 RepID=UPI000289B3B4|nr:2-hydroxy-3-oxopropionate reductase [Clostridium arbusti]